MNSWNNIAPEQRHGFTIICVNCDALGIVFDFPEDAQPSIQIKCQSCGHPAERSEACEAYLARIDRICSRPKPITSVVDFLPAHSTGERG